MSQVFHSPVLTHSLDLIHRKVKPFEEQSLSIVPFFNENIEFNSPFYPYAQFIETLIHKVLPPEFLQEIEGKAPIDRPSKGFLEFQEQIPILSYSASHEIPNAVSFSILCYAEYTVGVGRYISDVLSRWIVPGKSLTIGSVHSLRFKFKQFLGKEYYFSQTLVLIDNDHDRKLILNNIEQIINEMRLNILAVSFSRTIVSMKNLSPDQKELIIKENLASLVDRQSKEIEGNLFEHMDQFLLKAFSEKKVSLVKKQFYDLLNNKPNVSDKDIYTEIQHLLPIFNDKFISSRSVRYVGKIIGYFYLFRKSLTKGKEGHGKKRNLNLKIFKPAYGIKEKKRSSIGVLIGMNLLQEHEIFEKRHAFEAIKTYLPQIVSIKDSSIVDRRDQQMSRLIYFEIEKGDPFTLAEIRELRKKLPREIKDRVENVIHSIFMPRNEEEIIKNIVLLSGQLKYVHDIPQAIISFENQTAKEIYFNVVLLRLLHNNTTPIKDLLSSLSPNIKVQNLETKIVGNVRKKYNKEANVFSVKLEKKTFLRKDFSLDLFRARQTVLQDLEGSLGEIRDFNGGILSKQHEVFHSLKNALSTINVNNDFLLENYFYSLTPPLSRSILPVTVIKEFFLMLSLILDHDFKKTGYFYQEEVSSPYLMIMMATPYPAIRESIFSAVNKLAIPSNEITFSFVDVYEFASLGYILRSEDPKRRQSLIQTMKETLKNHQIG